MSRLDMFIDRFRQSLASVFHRGIERKPSSGIRRYLIRRSYLRQDVVNRLGIEQGRVTESVNPEEMAAVALLWCDLFPLADRSERLSDAIRDGWFDGFGDRFYEALIRMAYEMDLIGSTGHTHGMLKLGALAARILQDIDWADRFDSAQIELTRSRQQPWFRGSR